jgi:hypothetical protein
MKSTNSPAQALALKAATFSSLLTLTAHAETFIITNSIDTTNSTSLRGAIIAANAIGGTNVIVLTNTLYNLTIPGAYEDGCLTGDLDVTNGNLTVVSGTLSPAIISASGLGDRVFEIFSNAQLTISNVVITGGAAPSATNTSAESYTEQSGGGIYNLGTLTLLNCVISNNLCGAAPSGTNIGASGAGVFTAAQCSMTNCIIANNQAGGGPNATYNGNSGNGGGVFNSDAGMLALSSCVIAQNSTGAGGYNPNSADGGNGGGLYNQGQASLLNCVLSSNVCAGGAEGALGVGPGIGATGGNGGGGGGIYNTGLLQLISCTIADNNGGTGGQGGGGSSKGGNGGEGGYGGGLNNEGSASVIACSITYNVAGTGGEAGSTIPEPFGPGGTGGNGGNGGGIYNAPDNTSTLLNTLISSNVAGNGGFQLVPLGYDGAPGSGPDGSGAFTSQGFNLMAQGTGLSGITNGTSNDIVGTASSPISSLIGPLQNNGGNTLTVALLPGSPAIDAGDDALLSPPYSITVDQRGYPRKSGAHVDIGAFEYNATLTNTISSPVLTDETQTTNGFQFYFEAAPGLSYSVWASTNLTMWTSIGSATEQSQGWFSAVFYYNDSTATNNNQRFYQIRYP